jgi:hypothetical protein
MGSHQKPLESRRAEACGWARCLAVGPAGHQSHISNVAVSHERFAGNPSPLVSGAPWWDTSGALARLTP